jgi:hypothetical protein
MDPLSIAASACGIAALCAIIVSTVGTFVVDVKSLSITTLEKSVE